MTVTLDYIKCKFDEFNRLCFEGKLKPLHFKLSSASSFLGRIRCRREKNSDGTWHFSDFEFIVSNKMNMDEQEVDDTILHEMIHYYILSNQMQDTSPHGEIFIRMMKDLNVRFNRNISVTHNFTKEEQDSDTEIRQHLICVVRFKNNQRGVTVSTKSRLFQLWDDIPKVPNVVDCNWYVTTDPYFNRFPRAASVKIYSIPAPDLEEHLKDAQPLVRKGNTIRVKK